ncbi:MAG: type II toxin-antitoxin system VapC family toxin [Chloroflexi bacterium]|nr:type II toxin-antitoxin system VapC family toxin [Chloroflexota bacterium]
MVVDASVATKWHLVDEDLADEALLLLDRFSHGVVNFVAPQHIRYEIASAISVATHRRPPRLTRVEGRAAIQEFLAVNIILFDDNALNQAAYELTHTDGCAFYDGLYVALAQRMGIPLIMADDRLYRLVGHYPFVVWLADYS